MRELVVPRSVRIIADMAFYSCEDLAALSFEEGSQLSHVGCRAFSGTRAEMELECPNAVKEDGQTLGD